MEMKDIAAISGKPGLYKIVKPTRTGVIVEAIGGGTTKLMANAGHRISILQEISIYTDTAEGSISLEEVFYRIFEKHGDKLTVKKDSLSLRSFMSDIVPEHNREKVYTSDIKKLITWYNLVGENVPELLERKPEEEAVLGEEEKPEENTEENTSEEKKAE